MTSNTVHVQKDRHSSSWLGNSIRWFVVHEPVNIHTYITVVYCNQSFVGLWTHNGVWKCLVRAEESVLLQAACAGPLNKSLTVFFLWCDVVVGGGLFGVSERGGVMWVQGSHSLGEKAVEQSGGAALILRYRLPEGRSWKRLGEGWVGSFTILFALLEHRVRKISRMEGRGAPMIFAAVFTVRWRVLRSAAQQFPYQTVMQLVSTLSMVPL